MRKISGIGLLLLLWVTSVSAFQYPPKEQWWEPVKDEEYLQEKSIIIPTSKPVSSLAVLGDQCFAVLDGEVHLLKEKTLTKTQGSPSGINKLMVLKEDLFALSNHGLFQFSAGNWMKLEESPFVDACMHLGTPHFATTDHIFRLENGNLVNIEPEGGYLSSDITMVMEDGSQVLADPVKLSPIEKIESYSGTLHILQPGQLIQLDGSVVNEYFIDWGQLPSKNTREMLSRGGQLYISSDRGLAELRGATMRNFRGEDGLPVEDTRSLTLGFDNDIWIGTSRGAVRRVNDKDYHYFGASHWLPDNHVHDIAVGDNIVFIGTDTGIGILQYFPFTLAQKNAYYESHLEKWGHKRMGFIHTLYDYEGEWLREISDNDGGHTATYLAAMSYKYAVTGEQTARSEAVDAFQAMVWLERITPIDGLIARSIWSRKGDTGEMGQRGSGGLPAKWNATADSLWYWKGDASSDEVIAHFYSVAIFHDLVAEGKEKELAKAHMTRIAGYIIENGWVLIDFDGKPTRWGRWNPEYLLRPYGWDDKGVNGLEALAFSRAAYEASKDPKFLEAYQQLVEWGYPENTIRQKKTFPPSTIAPWDDNLAFESYMTLMRYEDDPELNSIYWRSLERTYEIKRMEQIPWFNFSYAALTGNNAELKEAVQHLREWTLDCREHPYKNSHRDDLFVDPSYISYEGGLKAISPREKAVTRGSRRAIVLDGGSGKKIMEPLGFIRDYWMGRYYGFIHSPESEKKLPKELEPDTGGAKPYKGPKRPDFL
ncbi:hypothetical protein [Pleomorphovibrio marinus]|uniref:hypothetical protein n=1 Tax=Pleomorphovibrio marinus TaxID=2164132 RepID=UPI000E0B48FA|nr:hypothetical protein [Pleomorphovibrio marinus]